MSEGLVRFVVGHLKNDLEPWVFTEIFQWFDHFAWEEEFLHGRPPRDDDYNWNGLYGSVEEKE